MLDDAAAKTSRRDRMYDVVQAADVHSVVGIIAVLDNWFAAEHAEIQAEIAALRAAVAAKDETLRDLLPHLPATWQRGMVDTALALTPATVRAKADAERRVIEATAEDHEPHRRCASRECGICDALDALDTRAESS